MKFDSSALVPQHWALVIRLILVLSVCLALPINAASSVYAHLHTDSEHQNDHHDGREIHRHAEPVEAHHDGGHHEGPSHESSPASPDDVTIPVTTAAWRPASSPVTASVDPATDTSWLPLADQAYAHVAPVGASANLAEPPPGLPDSHVASTPALRGPPR